MLHDTLVMTEVQAERAPAGVAATVLLGICANTNRYAVDKNELKLFPTSQDSAELPVACGLPMAAGVVGWSWHVSHMSRSTASRGSHPMFIHQNSRQC